MAIASSAIGLFWQNLLSSLPLVTAIASIVIVALLIFILFFLVRISRQKSHPESTWPEKLEEQQIISSPVNRTPGQRWRD